MNWIFVAVLVIFGIFMIRGWHRGLLRILFSLVAVIALILLVNYATPYVSDFIKNNTGLYTAVESRCEEAVQQKTEQQIESVGSDAEETDSLPNAVSSYIRDQGENALSESGIYEAVGSGMADWVVRCASFLIAFILAIILLNIISRVLNLANKIPVIKGINRTLGLFAGILQAYIVISVFFLAIALLSESQAGQYCVTQIDKNVFLNYLYYHNFLANLILK